MQLIFLDSGNERDYICNYLLDKYYITDYLLLRTNEIIIPTDLFTKYKGKDTFRILVYSSNAIKSNRIKNIITDLKPQVIFHNSDEWGNRNDHQELAIDFPDSVIFRQYSHNKYDQHSNLYDIPLSYVTGTLLYGIPHFDTLRSELDYSKRKYTWSFIGNPFNADRKNAVNTFQSWGSNIEYFDTTCKKEELHDIYKNTKFVLCPNGNVHILCHRIIEAICAGAIPVFACAPEILEEAFGNIINLNKNPLPQFIRESSWNNSLSKCKQIHEQYSELESMVLSNITWFEQTKLDIQTIIDKQIEKN